MTPVASMPYNEGMDETTAPATTIPPMQDEPLPPVYAPNGRLVSGYEIDPERYKYDMDDAEWYGD